VPLRLRLALIVAAGLTVLLLASGFAFIHQLRGSLTASIDTGLWTRRRALLASIQQDARPTLLGGTQILSRTGGVLSQSGDDTGNGPLISRAQARRALRGPLWLTSAADSEDPSARLLAFPLPAGSRGALAVVSSSTELLDAAVSHVEDGFLLGGPVVVIGGALAGWLLAGAALRPVELMRRQTASATADPSGPVLDVPATRDELAALAKTMNDLLARLRSAVARERAFVADAGHELRTPLAILRTELELATRPNRSRDELAAAVRSAAEETDRLARLAEALLVLAREPDERSLDRQLLNVADLLDAASSALQRQASAKDVRIVTSVSPPDMLACWDPDRVRQILTNLLENAIRHTPAGSTVGLEARPAADRVILLVTDEGAGFPEAFLPHAFERFTRAEASRGSTDGGAGLGLSIVDLLARAHGGAASAGNRPQGGAELRVEIPGLTTDGPGRANM
jgi:two-component system OmpR family sensor kinase